jgi:kynurenine formamidase
LSKIKQLSELLSGMRIIDLSHTLEEDMPIVPSHNRYFHTLWDSFEHGSLALAYQLIINEHTGTHIDATAHFIKEGHPAHQYMDETPLTQFFGRALTLDFSHYTETDSVTTEEIVQWERQNYSIEAGDIVNFNFGWDRHWLPRSVSQTFAKSRPGISGEAAEYLVSKKVKVVGCDVISIDGSSSSGAPAHYALLGSGVNIVENLTRLEEIHGESYILIFPLKIKQGSGSPIRAVAFK